MNVLVVDDSPVDRTLMKAMLQRIPGTEVYTADGGFEALEMLTEEDADFELMIIDIMMPGMDGIELTEQVALKFPELPIVVITAREDDEIVAKAFRAGASEFLIKGSGEDRLFSVVTNLLANVRGNRADPVLIECLSAVEFSFRLKSDLCLIGPLVDLLKDMLDGMWVCEPVEKLRIGVALSHAFMFAVLRHNLELSQEVINDIPWEEPDDDFLDRMKQLQQREPYCQRIVDVKATMSLQDARFTLAPTKPNFENKFISVFLDSGVDSKTVLILQELFDQVTFDEVTGAMTLIKANPNMAKVG